MIATKAIHHLGDISRDEPDLCYVHEETETDYIGNWAQGFGFIEVRFPKATTRPPTKEEEIKHGLRLPDNPSTAQLDNWCLTSNQDGYKAPEQVVPKLHGIVIGHPRISDGESITTSRLLGRRGDLIATRNTLYRLGAIDPEYDKLYPNAKGKMLASLPEV